MITLPHKTEHAMSKAKFGDFWRFWLLGVLKQGTYGMSIGDIYGGLAAGSGTSYVPGLAFKHVRRRLLPCCLHVPVRQPLPRAR